MISPVIQSIAPRARDIGQFTVARLLPHRCRFVGPFVFLDRMGPARLNGGEGIDVRPHPHIGLATLTYLLAGELVHRDSLGSEQVIRPGAVNWMTAGKGVVHSERSPQQRDQVRPFDGLQSWVALPLAEETCAPAFQHVAADALPVGHGDGLTWTLVAGTAWGLSSPVRYSGEMVYLDVHLATGHGFVCPDDHAERAVYLISGCIIIEGEAYCPGELLVMAPQQPVVIQSVEDSRFIVLGGAPLNEPRYLWWNFVSSSQQRLEQAKRDWQLGRFDLVPGDEEFIPLPGTGPA